jgi:hypothetical protein
VYLINDLNYAKYDELVRYALLALVICTVENGFLKGTVSRDIQPQVFSSTFIFAVEIIFLDFPFKKRYRLEKSL